MKSLKELEEIRNRAMSRVNMRHDRDTGTRIVVGMATCGIAAGARPVLNAFVEEVQKRGLSDVVVSQTGCIGVCRLEPMAEVYTPGNEKVTYVKLTADMVPNIINQHIVNGQPVIEQTIGEKLPDGFQRAEFQLKHGFVDAIVEREELKDTLGKILRLHRPTEGYANFDPAHDDDRYEPTELMRERNTFSRPLEPWDKVMAARQMKRLASVDYMGQIFDEFMELHGDRYFRDDPAIVGGIAYLDGQPVTVIGVHKGKDLKDCKERNFGMPSPEGYRKAIRLMKQAEKFNRPIITFVNTSGAYPGKEAEENGQGEAIARNLYEMSGIQVPILCLMIGEGGSGGALALAVGNEVWMMENATYSILSPEGFASILWKDGKRAKEAATVMKITAQDLKELSVVDKVIPEYGGADDDALTSIAAWMKGNMKEFLRAQNDKSGKQLAQERYDRFRRF